MTPTHLLRIPAILRALVGIVLAFQFFDNLDHDNYTAAGYSRLIESYVERGNAPGPWKDLMQFVADHASFFAPLQAVTEAALAIGLLVGVAVPLLSLVAGGVLTVLFVSELGIYWLWELPPLIAACALVALACAPAFGGPLRRLVLDRSASGSPFAGLPPGAQLAAAALTGLGIGALALANRASDAVSLQSGVAIAVLLAAGFVVDRRLTPPRREGGAAAG